MGIIDQVKASIALVAAADKGDLPEVKQAIADGAFINFRRGKAMQHAAARNDIPMVTALFHADADMSVGNNIAMKTAIRYDAFKAMHFFFEYGHDKDEETMRKFLLLAVDYDRKNAARVLIKHGGDVLAYKMTVFQGLRASTPLYKVLRKGKHEMLELFLNHTSSIYWPYEEQIASLGSKNRAKMTLLLRAFKVAGIGGNMVETNKNMQQLDIDLGIVTPKQAARRSSYGRRRRRRSRRDISPPPSPTLTAKEIEARKEAKKLDDRKKQHEESRRRRKDFHKKIQGKNGADKPKI